MVSLHATKLMHSVEGGFVVAKDPAVAEKVEWMRRFGHKGHDDFHGVGTNAKMSEFHAAMGLCCLNHIDAIIAKRKAVCEAYDKALLNHPLSGIRYRDGTSRSCAYYPVLFESEKALLKVLERCANAGIFPRRYFYPALSACFESGQEAFSKSIDISQRILCLPLHAHLSLKVVEAISAILKNRN